VPYAGDYAVLEDRTSRLVIFRRWVPYKQRVKG